MSFQVGSGGDANRLNRPGVRGEGYGPNLRVFPFSPETLEQQAERERGSELP